MQENYPPNGEPPDKPKTPLLKRFFSRSDLFDSIRYVVKNITEQRKDLTTRERATEFFGEGAALVSIIMMARKGAQDPVISYEVKSEGALRDLREFQQMSEALGRFGGEFGVSYQKSTELQGKWEDEFLESHTETRTRSVPDGDGGFKDEDYEVTVWEYEDPPELKQLGLDHVKVEQWVSLLGSISGKVNQTQSKSGDSFDLAAGDDALIYDIKEVDSHGQTIINTFMYGSIGAAYVVYEEVFNAFEKYGFIQQAQYVSRRSFLKAAVAGSLSLGVRKLQLIFVDKNTHLFQDLTAFNKNILRQLDVGEHANFNRYFGISLNTLRNNLLEIVDTCTKAGTVDLPNSWFNTDQGEWNRTKPLVEALGIQAKVNLEAFDGFFKYNNDRHDETAFTIPPEFTKLTKYIWATEQITGYAKGRADEIGLRHFLYALGLGAGLGAMAGLSEGFILPMSDKHFKGREE